MPKTETSHSYENNPGSFQVQKLALVIQKQTINLLKAKDATDMPA